ncbi:MAG: TetR/AcrR family transcriptional regulator, partial [Cyanobacteria bacterium J06642_9]
MPASPTTRQKLIQAALELFVSQGVSNTTTRQIANLAAVNEVTLFRHFGNKYGLLLAVLEESTAFTGLGETLVQQLNFSGDMTQALKDYASAYLHALQQVAPLVRSVI